jgi:hypothetical protein
MLAKSDLDVQQTHLRGQFDEQKLILSSSLRCDQIARSMVFVKMFCAP